MIDAIRLHPYRCPICGRWFGDAKVLGVHMALTTKHETAAVYIRRLEFMLAEAEDNLKFWREAVRMRRWLAPRGNELDKFAEAAE